MPRMSFIAEAKQAYGVFKYLSKYLINQFTKIYAGKLCIKPKIIFPPSHLLISIVRSIRYICLG